MNMYAVREAARLASRRDGFMRARDGILVEYSYFDRKSDSTIVFVNGWGTVSFSEWARQVKIRGHNLLMHNSRGMGKSGLGDGDYVHMAASDIAGLVHETGARKVHLVGHSMGGLVETLFFVKHKKGADVRTVTFVCSPDNDPILTFPFRGLLNFDVDRAIRSYEDGALGALASVAERSAIIENLAYLATRGGGVRFGKKEFSRLYHNFLSRREAVAKALESMRRNGEEIGRMLCELDVPTLIIAGRYDFLVDYTTARRIQKAITSSKLIVFEKSSHAPMAEEPGRFNRVLYDFLEYR
jgi:proline iminopeptidase